MTAKRYTDARDHVLATLRSQGGEESRADDAAALMDELVLGEFQDFLTLPGYARLVANGD